MTKGSSHLQPALTCQRITDAGLQSQQWGRKKAAALAAARLAEDGADPLRPHALTLLNALLTEVSVTATLELRILGVLHAQLAASFPPASSKLQYSNLHP